MDLEPFLGFIPSVAGFLAGLSRRGRRERPAPEEHPLRRRLLNLIRRRPGVRLSALWKQLDANRKTTAYHLMILARANTIDAVMLDKQVRFFPTGLPLEERHVRSVLLRGRVLEMSQEIARNPGILQKDLGDALKISRKVMRRYVDLLVEQGLLKEVVDGHGRRYFATERLTQALPDVSGLSQTDDKAQSDADVPGSARSP